VRGVKKDRSGQGDQYPQAEGEPFPVPGFPCVKIDLNPEKGADQAHPETNQENQHAFPQSQAECVERQKQDRNSRGMEGIEDPLLFRRCCVRLKRNLGRHVGFVVSVLVIVGEIQVAVLDQAVGNQQVMRFVAAE
jgi:hypothetical protein